MGTIVLTGATSGSTTLQPTDAVTVTCTLPSTGGTLQTSGSGYTANGVAYASSTSALTTGSALTFDGTNLGVGTSSPSRILTIEKSGAAFPSTSNPTVRLNETSSGRFAVMELDSSTNLNIWNGDAGSGSIRFYRGSGSGTESMRIDSSGNLLVGTTSSGYAFSNGIAFNYGVNNPYMAVAHASGSSSGNGYATFSYNSSLIGSITQNGTTGVLYNLTSDYRLKNDQEALTGAKDFIMALKPKKWQWWDGSGEGVGFVAHEFMEVAKYSGHGEKDEVDADGKPVYQSIQPSSSEVMANLVAFIQEQQTLIQSLTDRLNALESK